MARNYTRLQQRRYREERKRIAARVADRLMGKKKYVPPDMSEFFGGAQMQQPIQYGGITRTTDPRGTIFIGGIST